MKQTLLLLLLCAGMSATAQTGIPQLQNLGKDTTRYNLLDISPGGYTLGWSYYEYCTNVVCFNDGLMLYVFDSNGARINVMQFEKPLSDFATSSGIFVSDAMFDNEGNFYMAGRIHSNVNMAPKDPAPVIMNGATTYSNSFDNFIAKYRASDGHLLWAKKLAGTSGMYAFANQMHLACDNQNNLYILGMKTIGTTDIDPGNGTVNVTGDYIAKYNKDGDYVTHKTSDAVSQQLTKQLKWINNGLYLLSSQDSAGKQTMLLRQYDPATLSTIKSRRFGLFQETNGDNGFKKKIDMAFNQGNIWLLGTHTGTLELPAAGGTVATTLPGTERGFFLAKLNTNWDLTDARLVSVSKNIPVGPVRIGFDGLNNLMMIGAFQDSMDADLGPGKLKLTPASTLYKWTAFMAYYNQNLDLQWAKTFGDTAAVYVQGAAFGAGKSIYVTGVFMGNANFSLTGTPAYSSSTGATYNSFIARYIWPTATTVATPAGTATALTSVYPNPCNDQLTLDLGKSFANSSGVHLGIYDLSGRLLVSNVEINRERIVVNTTSLAPGMYYLKLQYGSVIEAHSFLKR
jgi:hypothetical protein